MPELPEVEAARRALHDNCCGRVILKASIADDLKVIDGVAPTALQKALTGRKILGAHRKGKNLWLQLDERPWPSFQFGMTGAFHIKGMEVMKYKRSAVSDKEEWPSKFSKVFLELDDGLEVSFTDKRRFARVRLLDDPATAPPISELGPDALLELPEESIFISSLTKKKGSIKALLLDQSFIAGIGNWVADEVLYQARIHPEQMASSLSEAECTTLLNSIREVIKLSVEVDADSEHFPESWIFHHRWDKKPGKVDGKKIEFITVGGRTSAYVPALQKCTGTSVEKQSGAAGKKLAKGELDTELLESDGDMIKKKGGRSKKKSAEVEEQVLEGKMNEVKGQGSNGRTLKQARRTQQPLETIDKSEELNESEGMESDKKITEKRKNQKKGKALGKTKENRAKDEVISNEQKTRSRYSKASIQEDDYAKPAVQSDTAQKRQGRQSVKKQAEQEQRTEQDAGKLYDEVGIKIHSSISSEKPKKRIGNEESKPFNMSQAVDTSKRTHGQKRKHGIQS